MNFTELIRLGNQLENLSVKDLQQDAKTRFDLILGQSDVPESSVDSVYRQNLMDRNEILQNSFASLEEELCEFRLEVKRLIEAEGNAWLQKSSARYEKELETHLAQQPEATELHKNKPTQLDETVKTMLKNRVSSYSKWNYPAIIIHPMMESFIQDMISSDPLYIVDESHYLIDPVLLQFNEVFRRRLRPYTIKESFDQPILDQLPNKQFGFCFAYNYLNYRPFEIIKKYLDEIYQKLLPGGSLAITFNDGDRWQAIQSVEQEITCYTPGLLIRAWAKYVGFEEIFSYHDDQFGVWLELKKPGTLISLRGGQPLAQILPKPIAESK
jgi:hypothetical protein